MVHGSFLHTQYTFPFSGFCPFLAFPCWPVGSPRGLTHSSQLLSSPRAACQAVRLDRSRDQGALIRAIHREACVPSQLSHGRTGAPGVCPQRRGPQWPLQSLRQSADPLKTNSSRLQRTGGWSETSHVSIHFVGTTALWWLVIPPRVQ